MTSGTDPDALDVCFVLPSLDVGGAERVVVNLANELHALGHRPRLLLTDRNGPLGLGLDRAVPWAALGRPRLRQALPGLLRELRRRAPDVVVTTHTHVNLALTAARPLLPSTTRLVIREPIHTPTPLAEASRWTRPLQRRLYRHADLVIATSETMRSDLEQHTGARVAHLPNPVDISRIRSRAEDDLRTIPRHPGRLLVTVGRLAPQKAYPDLFRQFARSARPTDRLLVFGEGPERAALLRLIAELDLEERVGLEGVDARHFGHVAAADAFILASTHEGMPNAVLEALALGTPVIAVDGLAMLQELAGSLPEGAITLTPREALAQALRDVPARRVGGMPAPSLLPDRFAADVVAAHFASLLAPGRR
jgi:glycosyltransferase involved in cell wall biosynthesis